MKHLNLERLKKQAEQYKEQYQTNPPFPHIVIDDFLDNLDEVYDAFPATNNFKFYEYNNPLEKKLAFDQASKLPKPIAELMMELSTPDFLMFLEEITGIEGLVPDPYFRGGGVHQSKRGGKLDMHVDFNTHPKIKLERRLNTIIYLNKNWQENWHGDLQLWEGHMENGKHRLVKMHQKIYPIFNRLVIFSTSEKSYHGHPEPLECPEDVTRNSLALYFYTKDRPESDRGHQHSTTYVKLPWEDDSLDELREKRNKGRLTSNIQEKGLQ